MWVVGSTRAPQATFFLLPGRVWEFAFGAVLAVSAVTIPPRLRAISSFTGISMLAVSVILLAGQGQSRLWPVAISAVSATLLIGSGPEALVNRALALPLLFWIGRISYSLYLWHWPIFAFLQRWWTDDRVPGLWSLGGIGASFALASATYRWVEQPARRKEVRFGAVAAAVAGGAIIVLIGAGFARNGLPERFTPRARAMLAVAADHAPLGLSCLNMNLDEAERRCRIGRGMPTAVIWGDSHATSDSAGAAAALGETTVVIGSGGCPPSIDPRAGVSRGCVARNRAILDWLAKRPQITTIVLVAFWPEYERADQVGFWQGMQHTAAALGSRRTILLGGVPYPGVDVPTNSATREQWGFPPFKLRCKTPELPLRGVIVVDLSVAFCAYAEPWRLFVDRNHPSMTANRAIIQPVLTEVLAGRCQSKCSGRPGTAGMATMRPEPR